MRSSHNPGSPPGAAFIAWPESALATQQVGGVVVASGSAAPGPLPARDRSQSLSACARVPPLAGDAAHCAAASRAEIALLTQGHIRH